ncbi:MAG: hypothetical protein K1060chlam2_01264 [Chlamydiae bacterium]|nr:hypothetical protein [Chlamydiota bacterium]
MLKRLTLCLWMCLFLLGGSYLNASRYQIPNEVPAVGIILEDGQHLLCLRSLEGKIELENGAQFKVVPEDIDVMMNEWHPYDHLTFSPNRYPFAVSDFFIHNLTSGGYVHADYCLAPQYQSSRTKKIHHIDPFYGEIYLVDGQSESRWIVDEKDREYLNEWKKGEAIIVGMNNDWYSRWFSSSPFILINNNHMDSVKFIRASREPL